MLQAMLICLGVIGIMLFVNTALLLSILSRMATRDRIRNRVRQVRKA